MEVLLTWKALSVFVVMVMTDVVWALYIRRTNEGKGHQAGMFSAGIMLFASYVTVNYVSNRWFIVPAALGAYVGTRLTIWHDHKKKEKEV